MEIIWYGHACFRLKGRQGMIVTDPYDKSLGLTLPTLKPDIVTISHDTPHHNHVAGIKGEFKVIDRPGEYEISDIFVTSINMRPAKKDSHARTVRNNVFVIDIEDVTLCHLGDINHVPTQNDVEDMGNIDILLVPVGGKNALSATQAAEVISLIEPQMVIPMHYQIPGLKLELDPLSKFLKEMGISKYETVDNLKVTKASLPDETQTVILDAKQ